MTSTKLLSLAALVLLAGSAAAFAASLPVDNPVYKMRCDLLSSVDRDIAHGTTPASLAAATRGLPGQKFSVLAIDRGQANNHAVACTAFYLGAIADRGNAGEADAFITLAQFEAKLAHGQELSFTERMKRDMIKSRWIGHDLSLNAAESTALITAISTTPIALTPPPAPALVKVAFDKRR